LRTSISRPLQATKQYPVDVGIQKLSTSRDFEAFNTYDEVIERLNTCISILGCVSNAPHSPVKLDYNLLAETIGRTAGSLPDHKRLIIYAWTVLATNPNLGASLECLLKADGGNGPQIVLSNARSWHRRHLRAK